ncbi:GT99 family glycosyltransferase N-terminal domain-containing protein [Desulfovibrio inopinatus]|uniref:capsular polysaccharide export protein, LipB/KpsS family n=1 Tax=Desulfovibrio inopinatus TaxID=102109 RepID=UPI0003F9DEE2|nr:hypothetical protein [Desulfovibrio inopinatus]
MKILFFIEPHPIRNNDTAFRWILDNFIKLIKDDIATEVHKFKQLNIECKILLPPQLEAARKTYPGFDKANFFLRDNPYGLCHHLYEKFGKLNWFTDGLMLWKDLLSGVGEITENYFNLLLELHNDFPFDAIVYWGNNGAVRKFSEFFSIPAISVELGCMRSPLVDTLYFDYQGVNGYSTLAGKALPPEPIPLNYPSFTDKFKRRLDQTFWPSTVTARRDRINILVPLQLLDDSNIIAFSQFSSMVDFLNTVFNDFDELNPYYIVKPHPGAKNLRWTKRDHLKCQQLCDKRSDVLWLDNFDNNLSYISLLRQIDGVATVNSSAGFEALTLGKPVISYGDSCYSGIVNRNAEDFRRDLERGSLDSIKRTQRATTLLNYYLVNRADLTNASFFIYQLDRQLNLFTNNLYRNEFHLDDLFISRSFIERCQTLRYNRKDFLPFIGEL